MFGCWTSVSRKSVLPVFKELNSILFYPVVEETRNVFPTGAAPNQQAIPAVDYLMSKDGGEAKHWVLAGTDYVYPRTTNKILEAYLKQKGVADADIMINYTPFGHFDWQTIVSDIKKFGSAGKKTAVVSTINGDANVPFYKVGNQGVKATDIPSVAFSVGEEELAGIDTKPLLGHMAAWNYFQSVKTPINDKFIADWKIASSRTPSVTNDPMEAHVIGFAMWVKAVEKVKSTDPDKVIDALPGIEAPNLTGGVSKMLPNHHITKPVFIGEVRRRPVRRGLEDAGAGAGRCLVQVPAGLQGPRRRLGESQVRQLQHRDQEVRGGTRQRPPADKAGGGPNVVSIGPPPVAIPGLSGCLPSATALALVCALGVLAAPADGRPGRALRGRAHPLHGRQLRRDDRGHQRRGPRERQSARRRHHRGPAGRPPAVQRRSQARFHQGQVGQAHRCGDRRGGGRRRAGGSGAGAAQQPAAAHHPGSSAA